MQQDFDSSEPDWFSQNYQAKKAAHLDVWIPKPPTSQDMEPDEATKSIIDPMSVIVKFISTNNTDTSLKDQHRFDCVGENPLLFDPENSIEEEKLQEAGTNPIYHPESEGTQSNAEIQENVEDNPSGRLNDENNAHKKMITALNEALPKKDSQELKKKLKKLNQIEKLDPKKSSRYGFVCHLLCIRQILPSELRKSLFQRFRVVLRDTTSDISIEAVAYLEKIKPVYIQAFVEVMEGNTQDALNMTYQFQERFRQNQYHKRGLTYVLEFEAKLKHLLATQDTL